ncbi:MAG TPA: NlpC/P60 family protein [Streptosporangiaceae bacterium]|nr:NlpC/P60 family protein [Streptosporangiaceae bacterium]
MHTPPSVRKIVRQRVAAVTVTVFAAGLLLGVTSSAGAAPALTVSQVQAKLKALQTKEDQLDQQYGQVKQELQTTNQQLGLINKEIAADSVRFAGLRDEIGRIAVADYEDGNINSSIALFTSGNPQRILNQSSILQQLSDTNTALIRQFLAAAKLLTTTQLAEKRTKAGIAQLKSSLLKRKAALNKLVSKEQALLNRLSPAQQVGVTAGGGQTSGLKYTGPTSSQADKAVQFAYSKVGCPYVYGGTGPCADGYDCSGLTMEAWAAAGVSIPRDSYDQESELPQVDLAAGDPTKYLEPGDILGFAGNSHVGIYVGGGKLIDAPHTGADVELISLTGWYASELDEAVRP